MMRFQFRLQRILDLAGHRERAALERLAAANRAYEAELERLVEAQDLYDRCVEELTRREAAGLSADQMTLERVFLERAQRHVHAQARQTELARGEVEAARGALWQARKERKTLEGLRERRLAEHRAAAAREEQKILDELALGGRPGDGVAGL